MSRWPTTRLGDLVRFVGGGTPSRDKAEYWNGNIPWASVKDLQSLEIERTVETITEDGLRNSASNVVPRNTVVIASRVGLGKVSITLRPMAINQDLKALVPFSGEILPRFLLYYFVAIADQIEGAGVGATVKGVTIEYLEKLEVPCPSLSDQHRIVGILDEAEALCRLRALADQRTSSIEAALFLEVFGSPAINPFDWPVESVGALYEESRGGVKCGPFGSALKKHEYTDSGVPVWGIPNVLPNQFVEAGSLYISHPKFEELRAYAVEPGDLLISRAGTVGRICVARPEAAESIIGTNLIRLTLDRKRVVPEFFSALMTHFAAEVGRLRADTNEGAYSFMNTAVLETLQIYVPPLKLQEGFAARVAEIRELKTAQVGSRKGLDGLFQSLLNRAFRGEL